MNNKHSKQAENEVFLDNSNEYYLRNKDLTLTKQNAADGNLQKMQKGYDLEVKNLIAKNKKLLAIVAHDIRSPMGLIIGFLGLLKDRINSLEKREIEEELEIALDSARKSFTLLDNLLNWAITENSIKAFQQEYSDIAILAQEEINNVKSFATQKQIKIYANDFPSINVFIDIDMIKSVFRNLLHNAIKNSFIRGEITISITKQEEYIEVTVEDNGIGIKEEIRKMLFSPKKTDLTSNASNGPRVGFGLILCKEIIDMHGGEIWVLSERGKGSKFKFTLPIGPQ